MFCFPWSLRADQDSGSLQRPIRKKAGWLTLNPARYRPNLPCDGLQGLQKSSNSGSRGQIYFELFDQVCSRLIAHLELDIAHPVSSASSALRIVVGFACRAECRWCHGFCCQRTAWSALRAPPGALAPQRCPSSSRLQSSRGSAAPPSHLPFRLLAPGTAVTTAIRPREPVLCMNYECTRCTRQY